jgi:hypothetical protein
VSKQPFVRVSAATAGEICAHFNLPKEARALLREGMDPREFVDALLANKQYVAGIDFISHALAPREGIWWGCLCMQHAFGENLNPAERAAAIAAVRWVLQPTEQNRAAAKAPADALGAATPAGALAAAVAPADASVHAPNGLHTPPAPSAELVSVAVKLATVKGDPARILDRQKAFVELGIEVGEGRFL